MGMIEEKRYTLDRFEGDIAVLIGDDASSVDVERTQMPENAKEGDSLIFADGRFSADTAFTNNKRAEIRSRFEKLKKKK